MATSGGQPGNQNGAKGRPFMAALQRALARAELEGDGRTINAVAMKVIQLAIDGDMEAIKVLADRLDGRPMQALDVTTRRVESLHADQARDLAASYLEASKRAALRTVDGNVIELKPAPDPSEPAA